MKPVKLIRLKNKLVLTEHAYERYVQRVEPIERNALEAWCKKYFKKRFREKRNFSLIQFGEVWWGYDVSPDGYLLLTTCYGKSNVDLGAAIQWEKQNNDRVDLKMLTQGRYNP